MTIAELLTSKPIDNIKHKNSKNFAIEFEVSTLQLMFHPAYQRVGRRVRQRDLKIMG